MPTRGRPASDRQRLRPWRCVLVLTLIADICLAIPVRAQDADVPVGLQIPLFLKVLSFDRQLSSRMDEELIVGVAYQGGNRESVRAKDDAVRALRDAQGAAGMLPLRIEVIDVGWTCNRWPIFPSGSAPARENVSSTSAS